MAAEIASSAATYVLKGIYFFLNQQVIKLPVHVVSERWVALR